MRLLVCTMLFPNALEPHHGVFVKERLLQFRERHDCAISVVAPVVWGPPFGPEGWRASRAVPREETIDGLQVRHPRFVSVPGFDRGRAALMASGMRSCLLAEAQRFQPSVLDVHYAWPDGAAAASLRPALQDALGRPLPLVITARGTDLNLSPGKPAMRRQIVAALARADHVICVSDALRRVALELGVPPERVTTLRNGVDVRRFTPGDRAAARVRTGLPPDGPVLLCVGHLTERKGQRLLLDACARLWAPTAGALIGPPGPLLVLVGQGEDEALLAARARALGIETRVRFAGAVPPADLPHWYRAADALVLPSSREGWPNVVLEALACGTPVLATAVWGTPEILTGCAAGLLVPPTVDGLAAGLQRLLELDRSAARPWAERFTWDATLSGMAVVFEQVARRAASA